MATLNKQPVPTTPPANIQNGFSLISSEKLLVLYSALLKCRMIGERARALIEEESVQDCIEVAGARHAASVGVATDLLNGDTISAHPADIISHYIKGAPLSQLFGNLLNGGGTTPTAAALLDTAITAAVAHKTSRTQSIAVSFWARESVSNGLWREAMNLAGAHRLPVIFVSLGSGQMEAETTKARQQTSKKPEISPVPVLTVDGADAVAIYRVACESIAHARRGNGATVIECSAIQPSAGPVSNMEAYLAGKGLFRTDWKAKVEESFRRELDGASRKVSVSQEAASIIP